VCERGVVLQVDPTPIGSLCWPRSQMAEIEFAEEFLPAYDVSDAIACVVNADRDTAWRELLDVDLIKLGREAPLVGILLDSARGAAEGDLDG